MVGRIASLRGDALEIHGALVPRQEESRPGPRHVADGYHSRSKAKLVVKDASLKAKRIVLLGMCEILEDGLVQNQPVSALTHDEADFCQVPAKFYPSVYPDHRANPLPAQRP